MYKIMVGMVAIMAFNKMSTSANANIVVDETVNDSSTSNVALKNIVDVLEQTAAHEAEDNNTNTQVPWAVSIQTKLSGDHLCTGNILSNSYVLTTCRCITVVTLSTVVPPVRTPQDLVVVAGVRNLVTQAMATLTGQVRDVVQLYTFPMCTGPPFKSDFGVAETEYFFYFTPSVQPLPDFVNLITNMSMSEPMATGVLVCWAGGWRNLFTPWYESRDLSRNLDVVKYVVKPVSECPDLGSDDDRHFVCGAAVIDIEEEAKDVDDSDHDSGRVLMCDGHPTALLSYRIRNGLYAAFNTINPASYFLERFRNDPDEHYLNQARSLSDCSFIVSTLIIFTVYTSIWCSLRLLGLYY